MIRSTYNNLEKYLVISLRYYLFYAPLILLNTHAKENTYHVGERKHLTTCRTEKNIYKSHQHYTFIAHIQK